MSMSHSLKISLLIIFILFGVSLVYLHHVYACLTVAFILAYLLDPIVTRLNKWGVGRQWGALITLVLFFLVIAALGVWIIPKIYAQASELWSRILLFYPKMTSALGPLSQKYLGYDLFVDFSEILGTVNANFGSSTTLVKPISSFAAGLFSTTVSVVVTVLGFLIIPLLAYYLLKDFPKLLHEITGVIPKRYLKTFLDVKKRLHLAFSGFIHGQMIVSSILAMYYCVALNLLQIDLALVLGLMAGFFNIIPYFGILSALALTLFIALVHASTLGTYIGILITFAVGMSIEGSILTPRIVGRKVGLNPLVLIVSLLVGAQLLGLVGMLLAIPLAAIFKVFVDVWLHSYLQSEAYNKV